MTAVCRIIPSKNIAMSVVPPPISTRQTPSCNSSLSKTASAEANGSKIKSLGFNPAFVTHLIIFFTAALLAVIIWKFASICTPAIPLGS